MFFLISCVAVAKRFFFLLNFRKQGYFVTKLSMVESDSRNMTTQRSHRVPPARAERSEGTPAATRRSRRSEPRGGSRAASVGGKAAGARAARRHKKEPSPKTSTTTLQNEDRRGRRRSRESEGCKWRQCGWQARDRRQGGLAGGGRGARRRRLH